MRQEESKKDLQPKSSTGAEPEQPAFTQVENAHAAGVGAMGRNDEKLPTGDSDEAERPNEPAY